MPLCVVEPGTPAALRLYATDPDMTVWWGSPVECSSAFARLRREGSLDDERESRALGALDSLSAFWHEVQPTPELRAQARRLLRFHTLGAADALQLAAGLSWAGTAPDGEMVTLDERLGSAARREGFLVLPAAPSPS